MEADLEEAIRLIELAYDLRTCHCGCEPEDVWPQFEKDAEIFLRKQAQIAELGPNDR